MASREKANRPKNDQSSPKTAHDPAQERQEEQPDLSETAAAAERASADLRPLLKPAQVRALQRTVGNVVVSRILSPPAVQRIPMDTNPGELAVELQERLTGEGPTGPHYSRLDEILVNVRGQEQMQHLRAVYDAYPGGGRQFMADLNSFCGRIPVHEGADPDASRTQYWERWTARLYDAGVTEIQQRTGTARPVTPTAGNLGQWRRYWRGHYDGGPGNDRSEKPMALWVLNNWQVVTGSGQVANLITTCGFGVPLSGEDYIASYSVLSAQVAGRAAAVEAGHNYFAAISGDYTSNLSRLIDDAQSFNESYFAANFPVWLGRIIGFNRGLDQRIVNWFQLNSQLMIPLVEGSERVQVLALHRLYQDYWSQGNYPPSSLLTQAGIRQAGAAP